MQDPWWYSSRGVLLIISKIPPNQRGWIYWHQMGRQKIIVFNCFQTVSQLSADYTTSVCFYSKKTIFSWFGWVQYGTTFKTQGDNMFLDVSCLRISSVRDWCQHPITKKITALSMANLRYQSHMTLRLFLGEHMAKDASIKHYQTIWGWVKTYEIPIFGGRNIHKFPFFVCHPRLILTGGHWPAAFSPFFQQPEVVGTLYIEFRVSLVYMCIYNYI